MNKLILLFILFSEVTEVFAQKLDAPSFALTSVEFNIKLNLLPDSLSTVNLYLVKADKKIEFNFSPSNGKVDTNVTIDESGNYLIQNSQLGIQEQVRILPGWLSVIPPLLAIFLALILRQVLVSLAAGVYIGAIFIYDYNPLVGLLRMADTIVLNSIADKDHIIILVFTFLIGGVVGIISRNGGTAGLANVITKLAKTARSGMIASWLMGLVVFFDDYANSLIIGNMMRPITDKLRISREKLAYIVDSTAAPVASIIVISTWIGYEMGLIGEGLKAIGSTENVYDVFIQTIPYRFYPIAAIFFVFLTSFLQRDFGSMYRAEKRARQKGELFEKGSQIQELKDEDQINYGGEKSRWYNGAVPILVILFGTIAGLIFTGINTLNGQGITDYSIQNIISNSDSYSALLWSSFLACIVAIIMTVSQKLLNLNEVINAWSKGVQAMLFACIILVFAWSISTITNDLKTADYIISILSDALNPRFLPMLIFIICGLISFATGTSWGTMAIVMPIVIPLAFKISQFADLSSADTTLIIHGVISSVLAGSVWGDHCSPIADTTILSSMASKCNHIDHVKTQLPYALLVGIICILLGDLPTAFGFNPYVSIFIIFAVLVGVLLFVGKKVPEIDSN